MTKFEEELFNKVPCKFELTTEAEYKKSTLINHFKNWHSDEEFQEKATKLTFAEEEIQELGDKIGQLESQLQQQSLPVVPERVAEFVNGDETELSKADRIAYLLKSVEGDNYYLEEYLTNAGIISQEQGEHLYAWATNQTHETILELWNGYTVEKPQLFRLKLKNAPISNYYLWLNQATGKVFVDKKFLDWTNHDNVKNIFTKQEIAKISDGAFVNNEAFELMPVEDGE